MIKKILLVLAAIIGIILIVAAFQSDTYRVERTATIAAPPSIVFAQVNDFHNWEAFNPWADMDTAAQYTYSGAPTGVGAVYDWAGNSNMGKGRMTIIESHPNEHVKIDMEFIEPFAGKAITEFALKPDGTGTAVTWSMVGEKNYLSKIMCMFMSMDKMIGGQYEKGFARMNALLAGTTDAPPSRPIEITRVLDASREQVWNAWTKPEEYMRWWGPKGYTCPVAHIDARTGGRYHTAMRSPEGRNYWGTGEYLEFVPMERIVFSDHFADSLGNEVPASYYGMPAAWPEDARIELTFTEADGRTTMTLRHTGVPAVMIDMGMAAAWNESFDKLAEVLKKN